MAAATYNRTLLLHTNSEPEIISLPILIQTASPLATQNLPYFRLAALLSISPIVLAIIFYLLPLVGYTTNFSVLFALIVYFGGSCLLVLSTTIATAKDGPIAKALGWTSIGIILVCLAFSTLILVSGSSGTSTMQMLVIFVSPLFYGLFGGAMGSTLKASHKKGFNKKSSLLLVILTVGLVTGMALFVAVGTIGLPIVILTGLPLFILLLRQHRLASRHKAAQQHLIKS